MISVENLKLERVISHIYAEDYYYEYKIPT